MMEVRAVNWLSAASGLTPRWRCVIVSRMKLLVVEDDPALQATLERTLTRRGFAVAVAGDGVIALQRWAATTPDAVVLDLSLPRLDGLQVLAQARAQGLGTPVLILTARGSVGDRVLGLNAGADDYLAKPFDLDELEARLRALVRRSAPALQGGDVRFGRLRHDRAGGAIYLDDAPMEVTVGDRTWSVGRDEQVWVPLGAVHRMANVGSAPARILEVGYGVFDEDDIVRIEDDYSRA